MRPKQEHADILTISLEDYFQVGAFQRVIAKDRWYRFETRLAQNLGRTLNLLARYDIRATIFVHGWIAEHFPELAMEIASRGHEVANLGYHHSDVRKFSREEFRDDLLRSHELLEQATGQSVVGYRISEGWLRPDDLWILEVLIEEGYVYDSSLVPLLTSFASEPERRFVHRHVGSCDTIWEFPPSTLRVGRISIPVSGGNYFRQFPEALIKRAVRRWHTRRDDPFVMYFHAWELDPEQPRIQGITRATHLRHYRNLGRMQNLLEGFFAEYRFESIASHLQLELDRRDEPNPRPTTPVRRLGTERARLTIDDRESETAARPGVKEAVSIVVPCYNEAVTLPYVRGTLRSVEQHLAREYDVRIVFVDDCSQDETFDVLTQLVAEMPNWRVIRHQENCGVAAAILSGVREADTEIICSIDCDCSYDPHELRRMIPLLTSGVDLVTASPYHPQGSVQNVPAWRLMLSRTLSRMYRALLPAKLHTYTSCFRVYRGTVIRDIELEHGGFLGIAEIVCRLALGNSSIVEYPTTLESRIFGESKMKIVRTVFGHLGLLYTVWRLRPDKDSRGTGDPTAGPSHLDVLARPASGAAAETEAELHESDTVEYGNRVAF